MCIYIHIYIYKVYIYIYIYIYIKYIYIYIYIYIHTHTQLLKLVLYINDVKRMLINDTLATHKWIDHFIWSRTGDKYCSMTINNCHAH